MRKSTAVLATAIAGALLSSSAMADVALGVRAGTFGYGADFDIGLTKSITLRLGYNTFDYSRTLEDTDVTYNGKLKISAASALFDWHVFNGGFRLTAGAVEKGPKIDVVGKPNANNQFVIDGVTYSAAQIGNATGTVKMGDSVAPYLGIGWGNTVDEEDRVTFLLDIGAIHTGAPKAELNFTCNAAVIPPSSSANCATFNTRIANEKADLEEEAKDFEWYPVVSLGFAVRF
ncbi:MAG: hypothetical protein QM808_05595 [Steroidobacteraceae bacterium]